MHGSLNCFGISIASHHNQHCCRNNEFTHDSS
jgi:hypothetical protein